MKRPQLRNTNCFNNRGSALIFSYLALSVMISLSAAFALTTMNELRLAQRYRDSTTAFWLAESGINQFLKDQTMLNSGTVTQQSGYQNLQISKDDTNPSLRLVNSLATVNGVSRHIQIDFPANFPSVFFNTISITKNLSRNANFEGLRFDIRGKTRISGTTAGCCSNFEDLVASAPASDTYLGYPDVTGNGIADEKQDFIEFNRALIQSLPVSERVYIQSSDWLVDLNGANFSGKKVVYVEGATLTRLTWNGGVAENQNLTVITDGILLYDNTSSPNNSRLDLISWGGYWQSNLFIDNPKRNGITYSHGTSFVTTTIENVSQSGSFIVTAGGSATSNVAFNQWWGGKTTFTYQSPVIDGLLPLGFNGLVGLSSAGYSATPSAWREL